MSDDPGVRGSPSLSTPPVSAGFMEESPLALKSSARLAERLEMLEQENKRLKADAARSQAPSPSKSAASQALMLELQQRFDASEDNLTQLRTQLQDVEKQLQEQVSLRESEKEQAADVLSAADERVDEAEKKAAELIGEMDTFKKRISEIEKERDEKSDHVTELERRVELLVQQATEEREDLLQQVEELRTAGQVSSSQCSSASISL
jgi:chromosome segregation ATPase